MARLGAFAGPPLGVAMIAPQTFLGIAALPALACAMMALLVPAALAVRRREEAVSAS